MAERKRGVPRIEINQEWCKACGICIAFCPKKVLAAGEEGRPIVVNPEACTWCELCELRCPDYAIELEGEVDDEKVIEASAVDAGQ